MKLSIHSPERRLIEGAEVDSVTVTGSEGRIQLLPGHAPMVGTLETGLFAYRPRGAGGETIGVISSGFFEVRNDVVSIMAETLELREEINVERARKAQKEAEQALSDASLDESKFKKYRLKLERAVIRQQVAGQGHG